ncbi:ABC transporter permease [Halococcus salifodinae]|uniref:ABC-type dipeptide/oligopeptide/nickel transport system, permease component n=1 Tax=Halococcus salifodinae DSM 8989 TaxID=1227456 RepID=M0NEW3_9EURY|nr:ABC transporter permease [Halococcus salifodinae]EMA55629.1 ABC-type dipeptide/oligopeptide/nickel transport system, permease component [Halococcus salifodinae DSM 8989]
MATESRERSDRPDAGSAGLGVDARWRVLLRRLARSQFAVFGLGIVALLVLVAALAPYIAPYEPSVQNYEALMQPPSLEHPFGTDTYGRDVFSRVVYGARYTVFLGVVIVGIQMVIGVTLGLVAGYYGGYVESAIMRVVDIALSIPAIVLALAIAGTLGGGIFPLVIAVSLVGWRGFTRLVRGDVKSVMEEEYIDSAKAAGVSDIRVITRYLLPNAASSIIVYATLTIPTVILWSAALSFLGMGVQPPKPEWGALISAGRGEIDSAWWIATFPGLAIMVTVIGFNAFGDGLRDALDPKQAE